MSIQVRPLTRKLARELDHAEIDLVSGGEGEPMTCPGPPQGSSPTGAQVTRCEYKPIGPKGTVKVLTCDDDFRGNP